MRGLVRKQGQPLQLALDQEARDCRQQLGDSLGGGVGAVGGAEGVHDKYVRQAGEPGREFGIVLLFLGMEAAVFQQGYAALRKLLEPDLDLRPDTVVELHDVHAQELAEPRGDRIHAQSVVGAILGTPQVRDKDDPAARGLAQVINGRQRRADAGVVDDLAVLERDVEVDAHEHALADDVDVLDGLLQDASL